MAYSPSTNTSGLTSQAHLASYKLRRKALTQLMPIWMFYQACDHDVLEARSGKTMRFWRGTNLAANTTPVPEGVIGTTVAIAPTKTLDATVSKYEDFITASDLLISTAPDAVMERMASDMGFRAGFSVDNITRSVIDAETGAAQTPMATYLSLRDFHAAVSILQGTNVLPKESGYFEAITHPYTAFDFRNDPSAGGWLDLNKYTDPAKTQLNTKWEDRGLVGIAAGTRIRQSTNVKVTSGTPNTWRTYIFGKESVGTVSLAGYVPGQVQDPAKEAFQVFSKVEASPTLANPTGSIGGFVSYRFTTVTKVLSGPNPIGGSYRYKYLDLPSSIVA